MRIGFGAPVAGAWASAENLARFAERGEALGYDSLWTFQRLVVGADQDLAPVYDSVMDPVVAVGFAAARTSRIRLGVAIVNLPFLSPAYLAKQAATVDVLSGGRLELGLGLGWSPVEFAVSGASSARRGRRAVEYVSVLRTLWNDEVSSFNGEFYTVPPARMRPRPVQPGGPPVLFGGTAPVALRRAGRIAAGWISSSGADLSRIAEDVAVVRAGAEDAGRHPGEVRIVTRGVVGLEPGGLPDAGRRRLTGSVEQIRADVAWLGEQGVTEVFYDFNFDPLIGSPDVDPAAATARAEEIMEALAPAPQRSA